MKRSNFLFALAAALSATPAFAASSASASIGPLALELIDLDLGDGITPSITFVGGNGFFNASASQSGMLNFEQKFGASAFALEIANAALGGVQAASFIGGTGTAEGSSFGASGSASDFVGLAAESARFVANVSTPDGGFGIGFFVLTPQTQLIVSASATITAQGTGASGNPSPSGDRASAVAAISIPTAGSDTLEYLNFSDGSTGFNYSESRTLTVSVSNLTASDLQVNYGITAQVDGSTFASAVPEPASAATLLAGLAGLALLKRRRRG